MGIISDGIYGESEMFALYSGRGTIGVEMVLLILLLGLRSRSGEAKVFIHRRHLATFELVRQFDEFV
jgi:hypothetical protein